MSKSSDRRERGAPAELPGDILDLIRDEIDSGLARVRNGNFEAGLREKAVAGAEDRSPRRPRPSAFRRWAPVCAVGLIAMVILIAVPSKIRISKSKPNPMLTALGQLPGIQSMSRAASEPASVSDPAALAESPFVGLLSALAASSSSASDTSVPAPPVLVPRYTLEQKIEILTGERPIERALVLIKSKFGEV